MKTLDELIRLNKQIRVIGIDDAPFQKKRGSPVNIAGIICSNTRFEGMLWEEVVKDGLDATDKLISMIKHSKFYQQTNVILTDGIAVGGFNIVDLPTLADALQRPCIAVMRKQPDIPAIFKALDNFSDSEKRKQLMTNAGSIHSHQHFHFQVCGCLPKTAAMTLEKLTDTGNVPEALRIAHLIGSAIITGQSSNRA